MKGKKWWLTGLVIAIFMACVLSPFASRAPDGLDRVSEDRGFAGKAEGKEVIHSPVPNYAVPGIEDGRLATALAGLVGVLIILGVTYGWTRILRNKR
jgi:cobalt/nickel transport protein